MIGHLRGNCWLLFSYFIVFTWETRLNAAATESGTQSLDTYKLLLPIVRRQVAHLNKKRSNESVTTVVTKHPSLANLKSMYLHITLSEKPSQLYMFYVPCLCIYHCIFDGKSHEIIFLLSNSSMFTRYKYFMIIFWCQTMNTDQYTLHKCNLGASL